MFEQLEGGVIYYKLISPVDFGKTKLLQVLIGEVKRGNS